MEFRISRNRSKFDLEWNGPVENLRQRTIISSISRSHHMKVLLFLPLMPTNHTLCVLARLRRNWWSTVGKTSTGARKALKAIEKHNITNGLTTDDSTLINLLEELTLDDVGSDLDLIAVDKRSRGSRITVTWIFCFSPDDISHFIENARVNKETICYGRNGDNSLP